MVRTKLASSEAAERTTTQLSWVTQMRSATIGYWGTKKELESVRTNDYEEAGGILC